MDSLILSIDYGLTNTKAVLFSSNGSETASSITGTEVINIGDYAEIDMDQQWKNTVKVIRDVIIKSKADASKIIGVGCSGHGAGLYSIDTNLQPARRAILSMDGRAENIIKSWKAGSSANYDKTCIHMWNGQMAPLLYWLKENEYETYNKIYKIFLAKDWINFKLTGIISTDYSDASIAGVINIVNKSYDRDIFTPFGIGEAYEKLPKVYKSTDIVGHVTKEASEETGLKEGTPVIGGVFDCAACALGSGVYDKSKYCVIAGTWSINSGINDSFVPSKDILSWSLFADISKYMCIESSATSAVNLEWCIKNILGGLLSGATFNDNNIYEKIEGEISKFKPDETNIMYMPFLYKSKLSGNMEGSFLGIKASHNTYHLLRAVYEGIVFAHLKHIENLKKGSIDKNVAVLSGGAAKSKFWCQMFADILNVEIVTTKASEIGALGVAISIAAGTGRYPDLETAIKEMVKEKDHYYPDEVKNKAYMKKYDEFSNIIKMFDSRSVNPPPTNG